jgi:hypothetical protein
VTEVAWRVVVGLNYPTGSGGERRAEPGDIVTDLPAEVAESLAAEGAIAPASEQEGS